MHLELKKRMSNKKSVIGSIRRLGGIPGVLYLRDKKKTASIKVEASLFESSLRKIPKGCLATEVFPIDYEGTKSRAIVKDIDYHRVTYCVQHIDFMEVCDEDRICVNMPILYKGEDLCEGIKQGGQLKLIRRFVKTSLEVGQMPKAFTVDVSLLKLGSSFRVRDLPILPGMRISLNKDQVLVSVSK